MVAGVVREVREEQRQQRNGGTKGLEAALLYSLQLSLSSNAINPQDEDEADSVTRVRLR